MDPVGDQCTEYTTANANRGHNSAYKGQKRGQINEMAQKRTKIGQIKQKGQKFQKLVTATNAVNTPQPMETGNGDTITVA